MLLGEPDVLGVHLLEYYDMILLEPGVLDVYFAEKKNMQRNHREEMRNRDSKWKARLTCVSAFIL